MYSSNYDNLFVALGAFALIIGLIVLAVLVVYLVALWKVFVKAGKQGWEAIIPFYNSWILVEIAGLNWWWFLLIISGTIVSLLHIPGLSTLCSLANLVAMFFCNYNIAKKFHQEVGYAILMTLFPFIMYAKIGFSDKVFDKDVITSPNGPIGENNNNKNTTNTNNTTRSTDSNKFCTNCGTKINGDEKFCTNCGTKIN